MTANGMDIALFSPVLQFTKYDLIGGIKLLDLSDSVREKEGGGQVKARLTITEVADMLGVSSKTLARWEKVGKIRKPKRDWRGWRVYHPDDIESIRKFHEAVFEVS